MYIFFLMYIIFSKLNKIIIIIIVIIIIIIIIIIITIIIMIKIPFYSLQPGVKVLTFTGRKSTAVPITLAEQADEAGMGHQSGKEPGTHLNYTVKK